MKKRFTFLTSWFLVFSLVVGSFAMASEVGTQSDIEKLSSSYSMMGNELTLLEVVSDQPSSTGRDQEKPGALLRYDQENIVVPSTLHQKLIQVEKHDSELFIIEFTGPIHQDELEKVKVLSVEIGDYLPEYSFIAKIPRDSLEKVKEHEFIHDIKPFLPIYKVDPRIFEQKESELIQVQLVRFSETAQTAAEQNLALGKLEEILNYALSDEIVYIGLQDEFRTYNDEAAKIIKVTNVRSSLNLQGEGQIVGVADTGLDTGRNDSSMHLDFQGRIAALYALGRTNDSSDPNGHGTHVAGSILGNGARSNGSFSGMAPKARLVFQSIMDSSGRLGGLPSNLNTLFTQAWNAGARIHSNSWGADVNGAYTTSSQQVDQYVWNNNDMTILFAAGNAGPNTSTVGSPATAKNAITVGASENYRPSFGSMADNINHIASFSSRGNTADGRIKPDVVAPGTYILSTRSSLAPNSSFWANYNSFYAYMGGTSMATPITTGSVALLREHFVKNKGITPKASLLKAALIAGATNVGLGYPSPHQGWGRVTIDKSMNVAYVNETTALQTSQTARYTFNAASGKPLRISLVWTDYPGNPSASKQLVNDLDLIITAPNGTKYVGNDFSSPFDNNWDGTNNVENVFISSAQSGTYTIEVNAYNVPSGSQRFALVVLNE